MRSIGTLPQEDQARLFGDFLFSKGIRNSVEHEGGAEWTIWIAEDEQLAAARELLERFRRDPAAAEFRRAAGATERALTEEEQANERFRRRFRTSRQLFPGFRSYGAGLLTYALIVAAVAVALYSQAGRDETLLRHLFISDPLGTGEGWLPEVRSGELWRLVTPMLIHSGEVHLIFNMIWLFSLGSMVEGLQGRGKLIMLIFAIAALSNLAQYFMGGPKFGGMSGVNYGLFGYVWLRGRFDPASGLGLDHQRLVFMLVWLVVCMTGWVGPVANWAHGGGFAVGALWGWLSGIRAQRLR